MNPTSRGRTMRRWAGASFALLALLALAPAASRAGCVHGTTGEGTAHYEGLILAGAMPPSADQPPLDPSERPAAPCTGAFCSRTPAAPPPPAPSLASGRLSQCGCLNEPPVLPGSGPRFHPLDESPRRPVRRGPAVFHPPRTA